MLDYAPGNIVYVKFATVRPSTGAPFSLAGGTISIYKDNSVVQSTAGVSLTADFDGVTGLNHVTIDTSADGAFYSAGSSFQVVITAGTVDSVSVVGQPVGEFTLNRASVLRPTTAGRTLDVSAGGEAGIDLANVGSPTTTLNLSGTTISTSQAVASVTGSVGSVTGNVGGSVGSVLGNVGGSVSGSVGSVATGGISSASFAAGAINAAAIAADAITDAKVAADVTIASVTGAVGSVTGAVGSVTAAVTVGAINANVVNASALASDAVAEIQSGLATAANLAIVAGYLDTEVAAIKAVTDKLDTAMVLDGAVYQFTANALELGPSGGGGGGTDWTADERTAIRTILGIPASGTTPEVPSAGALRVIDDLIDTEITALTTAVADVPTVAEFEARTILAASYATATELAKVIKTGEAVTKTRTGKTDVIETVTRN